MRALSTTPRRAPTSGSQTCTPELVGEDLEPRLVPVLRFVRGEKQETHESHDMHVTFSGGLGFSRFYRSDSR